MTLTLLTVLTADGGRKKKDKKGKGLPDVTIQFTF
jgi:hypothetical protein